MKLLIVGIQKKNASQGTNKDGSSYNSPERLTFECLRASTDPTHSGLYCRTFTINADSPFYKVASDVSVGESIDIDFETTVINGRGFEKCIDLSVAEKPFSYKVISTTSAVK